MSFIELQTIDSTNNYALKLIHAGLAQHRQVVFAHEQTAGKGQRGKKWVSSKGTDIALSIIIKPAQLLIAQQFQLIACVAVAVHDSFRKYAGEDTRIKWPNDLYWKDRKAGGILIESVFRSQESGFAFGKPPATEGAGSQASPAASLRQPKEPGVNPWQWAVIGIGININQTSFPPELQNPVSLKQIVGKNFNVVELAKEICLSFNEHFEKLVTGGFEDLFIQYLSHMYKINERVKLKKGSRVFEAMIKAVSPAGRLIVQHSMEEEFDFGEIEWVP